MEIHSAPQGKTGYDLLVMMHPKKTNRGTMLRRIAGVCGITSQLVALIVLLVVISSSPWFSWTENELSDLGSVGSATTLFNLGYILTGVLSLIFAIGLGQSLLSSRLGQLGAVSLILGSMMIPAIGIFPRTFVLLHNSASMAALVFIIMALLLIGVAAVTTSQMKWGLLSLTIVALIIVVRLVPWPLSGGAIQQLLISLPWSLWTIVFGVRLLIRSRYISREL